MTALAPGTRIGIPWLGWSCGTCEFCRAERENLCPNARISPAINSMAGTPNTRLPMPHSAFHFQTSTTMYMSRHSFAPG